MLIRAGAALARLAVLGGNAPRRWDDFRGPARIPSRSRRTSLTSATVEPPEIPKASVSRMLTDTTGF
jgi:hypothetical protein